MNIGQSTFNNSTEVDLTNNEHKTPNLTLIRTNIGYVIKNYITGSTYLEFTTLAQAISYCNNNFNTNFKIV